MGNPFLLPIPPRSPALSLSGPAVLEAANRHLHGGRTGEAERLLSRALALDPGDSETITLAGAVARLSGLTDLALRRFGWAARLEPDRAAAHGNLCEELRRQGRLEEALRHGRLAIVLAPDAVDALYNLGIILYDRLEVEDAILWERRAVRLSPTAAEPHFELAEALLLSGRLDEGWREYEWRFRLPNVQPPVPAALLAAGRSSPRPHWDSEPGAGRLLLVADQGFGDVIQFARYIPWVERIRPDLVIAGSAEMRPILRQMLREDRLCQGWDRVPDFDCWCPLSGLPRLLGTSLATIPAMVPYLRADPDAVTMWRGRLDGLLPKGVRRIGLVWAGRSTHGNDRNRSLRLRQLAALSELDHVGLVSLQMGPAQADIGHYFGKAPLVNLGPEIHGFDDTMAILQGLDRLVSVDTAVAHLGGAMGVPVSILLPFAPDWRWLLERGDTPWYPTATLHRQRTPSRWDEPVQEVAALLRS